MASERGASLQEHPVVKVEERGDACVVQLGGELDLYNAHVVREALLSCAEGEPRRVVVDLSAVDFIDSTALGVLIEARAKLHGRGGFSLAAPGLETRRALEISGLDRHFFVHASVDEALEAPKA